MLSRNRESESELDSLTLKIGNVVCDIYPTPSNFKRWYAAHASVQQLHSRDNYAVLREIKRAGLGEIVSKNFYNAAEWKKIASVAKMAICAAVIYASKTFELDQTFRNVIHHASMFGVCYFTYGFLKADLMKRKVIRRLLGEPRTI